MNCYIVDKSLSMQLLYLATVSRMSLRISTNPTELDISLIHRFLSEQSYWAKGIPLAVVEKSIRHSLCFGGYQDDRMVAFARVISDYATFANLVDVFVLPEYRGKGLSKQLMAAIVSHPELQGLRRFTLSTSDAHSLYEQFGFKSLAKPQSFMERHEPTVYSKTQ
jgi:GNAT superfamily N-acetyltransferase